MPFESIAALFSQEIFSYMIIPILIFLARVLDVSMGTIRIILTNRGYKFVSSFIGFFEILIWLSAITNIMQNLTNVWGYIAYALGFATGTFTGIVLEEWISLGIVNVKLISKIDSKPLLKHLNKSNFTYVCVGADSADGKVNSISCVVSRKDAKKVIEEVMKIDPNCFYTIEDLRIVGDFRVPSSDNKRPKQLFASARKGK
jgi:uncharacterized protein YebE (UPF0316 family)